MAKGNGLIFLLFRFSSSPWCECVCALYFSRKNRVNALIWLFCLLWAFVRAQHMQHQVNAVWNSWIRDRCDYIHLYTHTNFSEGVHKIICSDSTWEMQSTWYRHTRARSCCCCWSKTTRMKKNAHTVNSKTKRIKSHEMSIVCMDVDKGADRVHLQSKSP